MMAETHTVARHHHFASHMNRYVHCIGCSFAITVSGLITKHAIKVAWFVSTFGQQANSIQRTCEVSS